MTSTHLLRTPYLNSKDAARYLCTTPGVLANQRSKGVGPIHYKAGSKILYALDDLDRYVLSAKVSSLQQCA